MSWNGSIDAVENESFVFIKSWLNNAYAFLNYVYTYVFDLTTQVYVTTLKMAREPVKMNSIM